MSVLLRGILARAGRLGCIGTAIALCVGCDNANNVEKLNYSHEVTVTTPSGNKVFASTLTLVPYPSYNFGPGDNGSKGLGFRLTGNAVRVPVGDLDFYFLLTRPGTFTAATTQFNLVRSRFGIPPVAHEPSTIDAWNHLARGNASVELHPSEYPAIAVLPRGGWVDEARLVDLGEAAAMGLKVKRYRLRVNQEDPQGHEPLEIRHRPLKAPYAEPLILLEQFTVKNGEL